MVEPWERESSYPVYGAESLSRCIRDGLPAAMERAKGLPSRRLRLGDLVVTAYDLCRLRL